MEVLDPQRFERGVPVEPARLEPVMVRRATFTGATPSGQQISQPSAGVARKALRTKRRRSAVRTATSSWK
jgi:hypothetical protein